MPRYFFDHYNEKEIIATIKDNNIHSWKTAEKCGFELTEIKMYKDLDDEKEELYRFYKIKSTDAYLRAIKSISKNP